MPQLSSGRKYGVAADAGTPPLVTLGLPVYNGERFLREAIDSILTQTHQDFELIISDNGSIDDTEAICRDYANRERRTRYYRGAENRGAAWNFNRVFELARGRYFKWVSHDDICAPTYLERCLEVLETGPPSVVLCYPRTLLIEEDGSVRKRYDDRLDLTEPRPRDRIRRLVRDISLANPIFGLIRSEALRRTRLLGNYVSADYVLLAELALLGQFREVEEELFFRRRHPGASRFANRSPTDVAAWFDPSKRDTLPLPFWRLFVEHLRAIARSPLPTAEKVSAGGVFAAAWRRRHARDMARDLKAVVLARRASCGAPGRLARRGSS